MPSFFNTSKVALPFPFFLYLGFILAGLAGNYFHYPLFLNIDFLFGSIFAMLALHFFGIGQAVVAAALISGYTYFLWNHPYAIVIMTTEVAVVGWLAKHRKMDMVIADTLYWLCIGMPLVYFFYGLIMGATNSFFITMIKQATNGIANTLIAQLIFTFFVFRSRDLMLPLREVMTSLLASFVLLPTVAILMVDSRTDFAKTDHEIKKSLVLRSQRMNSNIQRWLLDRSFTLTNLAQLAVTASPGQVQSRLDELLHTDKNIQRYGLLDASGTVAAVAPLIDELGQNNIGKNFSNRPHFAQVKRTLQPMLTGVIMSRIGAPQPTVLLLAPVVVDGQFGGHVFGKIALEQLQPVLENDIEGELRYVLVDKDENVIISNREDQKIMHPFVHGKGSMTPLDAGIMQWVPEARKNKPISERWKDSLYVLESPFKALADWKLILEQPIEPFQKILYKRYADRLFLLFAVLLCSLGCAAFVSRRVLAATEKLSLITVDLAPRLAERDPNLQWPVSNLTETNQLICNFKSMADELTVQFTIAQRATLILEERVQERTLALRESRNLFRTLTSHAPVGIFQADSRGHCTFVNAKWCELAGLTEEQAMGRGWIAALHPDDRERITAAWNDAVFSNIPFSFEYRFVTTDGAMNWVYGVAIHLEQGFDAQVYTSCIGCVVDITERKRAEDELRGSKERAIAADEAKTRLLSTVAHEFRTPLALLNSSLEILDGYSDRLNSEQRRNQEQLIRKATNQLKVLVDTVLSYNQMESLGFQPSPRTQHIGTLVAAIADEAKLAWAGAHNFQVAIAPECGFAVLDEALFRRILENLLANAFQYTEPGGLVSLHVFRDNGGLQMTVTDQGIGISATDQDRVFDPFYRGQNVGSRRGMGLGLSIVRDALLQLEGTITMVSAIGKGTTFAVEIPLGEH